MTKTETSADLKLSGPSNIVAATAPYGALTYPQEPNIKDSPEVVAVRRLPGVIRDLSRSRAEIETAQKELGEIEQGWQFHSSATGKPTGEKQAQITGLRNRVITTLEARTADLKSIGELTTDGLGTLPAAEKRPPQAAKNYQERLRIATEEFEESVRRTRKVVVMMAENLARLPDQDRSSVHGPTLSTQLTALGGQLETAVKLVKDRIATYVEKNSKIACLLGEDKKTDQQNQLAETFLVEGSPAAQQAKQAELRTQLEEVKAKLDDLKGGRQNGDSSFTENPVDLIVALEAKEASLRRALRPV